MIVVDNNNAKENELLNVYKEVRRLINAVRNYVAKKWMTRTTIKEKGNVSDNFQNAYYRNYVKELLKKKKKIVDDVKSIIDIFEQYSEMLVYLMTAIQIMQLKQVVLDMMNSTLKQLQNITNQKVFTNRFYLNKRIVMTELGINILLIFSRK